jgi:glycosyltransferase involved in cell wall biosynthesis
LRIVFLSTCQIPKRFRGDPAFVYRCENLGRSLAARGFDVDYGHVATWDVSADVDAVVVQRPRLNRALARVISVARRARARLIADFDDLLFDETYATVSPAVRNRRAFAFWARRRFRRAHDAARLFDQITVSSEPLAEHARRCFPGQPVTVLPNAVHGAWRELATSYGSGGSSRRTLVYLPGTRTHSQDFASINEPLQDFLRAHSEVQLRITGPLRHRLDLPAKQFEHQAKLGFATYHAAFDDAWVNLAPLEDTPFNRCKSALKAIEAGYWNVPTVCSPNPDFNRFADAGALAAMRPEEWSARLEWLLDGDNYRAVTQGLRERVLARADIDAVADRFVADVLRGDA